MTNAMNTCSGAKFANGCGGGCAKDRTEQHGCAGCSTASSESVGVNAPTDCGRQSGNSGALEIEAMPVIGGEMFRCRCGGRMRLGIATWQTAVAWRSPAAFLRTWSYGGTGRVIACWKCDACGASVTKGVSE